MRYIAYKVCVISVIFGSALMIIAGVFARPDKIKEEPVQIHVIATDRNEGYVPDLKKEEITILDDDVAQQTEVFTTGMPSNIVLMLDTSACAPEKFDEVQSAAIAFLKGMKPDDRVKILSFDEKVHELSEFTSDKAELRRAINSARSGEGTKVYDAIKLALDSLAK